VFSDEMFERAGKEKDAVKNFYEIEASVQVI
jgi:hypothetical protein